MAAGADSLGVAVLELTANPVPLNAMLASSERRTEMSMARMEAMSGKRLATVGQNMSRLGSQWTHTVTLPIVAGGAAMIKVASDFEGALTQVQTQAGASAGEIENMRKAILKLAPATGQTPVQLANALFHVESAGLRGAKALDVLTQSAKLAKIGHSDLEQTTSALVAVMKSAPKDVKNATDAIGLMNAVVGQGNMRMGDLVGALSTGIIPAAKSAGLGLRDVGAAIDVMTTRGIPAQLAATRLAMSISLMSAPTGKAAKELASVGLKSDQLATDLRKPDGLVVAVRDLKTHMDAAGLSATQQNALIAHAFGGGRSSKAILTLVQNTGDLQKAFDGIGKHSGAGVVAEAWKKSQEDIGVRLEKLKAKAQAAFVDIGTTIAPEFIKVGTQVADDATKIAHAFSSLPKGAQDLIITGGLTAAAMGPVLRLAGVLTTFAGRTWDALKIAKGLAAGDRTLFGNAARSAASGMGTVATMEVGTMIVRGMAGGSMPAGGVTPIGKAASKEVVAAETAAAGGFRATAVGVLSRVAGASFFGLLAAPFALALGHAVNKWIHDDGLSQGRAWADKFLAPFPKALRDKYRDALAQNETDARAAAHALATKQPGSPVPEANKGLARGGGIPQSILVNPQDLQRYFFTLGFNAAYDVKKGLEGVKFTSAPILIRDFMGRLRTLRTEARPEAAKAMIAFAEGLQRQGKLPKHSVDAIIASLEQSVKGLGPLLARQGLTSDKAFAKALKFTAASKQLKDTLDQYRTDFGDLAISTKITGRNIDDNAALAMKHLRENIAGSTGEARRKYQAHLDAMKHATNQTFDAMAGKVETRASEMKASIQSNTKGAKQAAIDNFASFQTTVYNAMQSGALSTSKGSEIIAKALNATLKAMGVAKIPVTTIDPHLPKTVLNKSVGGAAQGALIQVGRQGERGHDTVPMNVGGMPIMVAPGEKVAVFNDAQQHVMNRRLADYGGLPGFFSRVNRPHYMARGGMIPGFAKGGTWQNVVASAESLGGTGYKGNPISAYGYSELGVPPTAGNVGTALGRLPYQTHMRIRSGSHEVVAGKQDIGTGSSFNPVMGLYPGTVSQLGLSGGQFNVSIERADGVPLTVGSGSSVGAAVAAAFNNLTAPKVKGTGTIPRIVRVGLGKVTDAANAYGAAHAPAPTTGGGGAGPVFPIAPGKVPAQVQWALQAAQHIADRHPAYGHMGAGWGLSAYDCSSYVSTVMDAAGIWPKWTYYTAAEPINAHTDPGPGKWITLGTWGTSGQQAHTMMEIDGRFFESGGGGGGPHVDSGWSMHFDQYRHPRGFAAGGFAGDRPGQPGYQPTDAEAAILSMPSAARRGLIKRLNRHLPAAMLRGFDRGGIVKLPPGGGKWYDRFTYGSVDSAGNSGGFNQAGSPYAFGRVPHGPSAGPWWAEGDRGTSSAGSTSGPGIGKALGGKRGGQAMRITADGKSTIVYKVDTGDGNSYGDIYPGAAKLWDPGFYNAGSKGFRADFISDAQARDLVRTHGRSGGSRHDKAKAAKPKTKPLKPLPKFRSLLGFDPSDMTKIQAIEDYLNNKLSPWQGLITGIHGRVPVPPKSVADRLAEIGHLGNPPDLNTELGIDQKFLDEYFTESVLAGQAQQNFLPWLRTMMKDRKAQQDRIDDTQATIDRLTYLKARLPQERKDRDYAISTRFQLARHRLQTSSAKGTFDAGQLLSDQLSGLSDEEKKARQAITSKPPPGWSGTKAGWAAQRNRELGSVSSEFADRRAALKKAAKEHKFEGRLARSNALFGLRQAERAEKHQLSDVFSGRTLDFTERLKDRSRWLARYKRLLSSDETALTAATGSKDGTVVAGSGSFEDTLRNLLDPMGPLAINIATKKDIDIPNLIDEIGTLKGTDATGTSAQLATLLQQANANLEQQLAVSQDQYKVLAQLPPFGGSFLSGGVVPGMLGEPRTIIAHGGEPIFPAGTQFGGSPDVHVHIDRKSDLADLIDVRIDQRTRQMSKSVKGLPGARAGMLGRR